MRKLLAILLLLAHLFNMGGYQILFSYFEQKAATQFIQQLDRQQYNEADLVEVKVPVRLPYHNNWSDFERYDGEITIEGIHYNYVKRKVYNDTLILMCLPNQEKMKMQSARDEFFSLVNDLQSSDHENGKSAVPKSTIVKTVVSEYGQPEEACQFHAPGYCQIARIVSNDDNLISTFLHSPGQPPELIG